MLAALADTKYTVQQRYNLRSKLGLLHFLYLVKAAVYIKSEEYLKEVPTIFCEAKDFSTDLNILKIK